MNVPACPHALTLPHFGRLPHATPICFLGLGEYPVFRWRVNPALAYRLAGLVPETAVLAEFIVVHVIVNGSKRRYSANGQGAIVAFNGVGVYLAIQCIDILTGAGFDSIMSGNVVAGLAAVLGLIRHQSCSFGDVLFQGGYNLTGFQGVNDPAPGPLAVPVNPDQDVVLVSVTACAGGAFTGSADNGLIRFNDAAAGAEDSQRVIPHGLAEPVSQEPGRFKGNAQSAVQPLCTDALLAAGNKVYGLQPQV